MRSLYYSSLNAKMRRYKKDNNLRELLDQLHNENLKEELEKDNALFNKVAAELRKDQLKKQYKEQLMTPEQRRKEVESEIAREALKRDIISEQEKSKLIPLKQLHDRAIKQKAFNALFEHKVGSKIHKERKDKAIKQKAFNALFQHKVGSKIHKEREMEKEARRRLNERNYEYAIAELQNELENERAKPRAGRRKGSKNKQKRKINTLV